MKAIVYHKYGPPEVLQVEEVEKPAPKENFTRHPQRYDLILAVNRYHSLSAYKRALNPGGVYGCAGGTLPQFFEAMLFGSWMSRSGDKKLTNMGLARVNQEDLVTLGEFLEAGKSPRSSTGVIR